MASSFDRASSTTTAIGNLARFCWYSRFWSTVTKASFRGGKNQKFTVLDPSPSEVDDGSNGMAREMAAESSGD